MKFKIKDKEKFAVSLIMGIFFIAGLSLVVYESGWITGVGLFLFSWANNYSK